MMTTTMMTTMTTMTTTVRQVASMVTGDGESCFAPTV
jgi:hypothetical protein